MNVPATPTRSEFSSKSTDSKQAPFFITRKCYLGYDKTVLATMFTFPRLKAIADDLKSGGYCKSADPATAKKIRLPSGELRTQKYITRLTIVGMSSECITRMIETHGMGKAVIREIELYQDYPARTAELAKERARLIPTCFLVHYGKGEPTVANADNAGDEALKRRREDPTLIGDETNYFYLNKDKKPGKDDRGDQDGDKFRIYARVATHKSMELNVARVELSLKSSASVKKCLGFKTLEDLSRQIPQHLISHVFKRLKLVNINKEYIRLVIAEVLGTSTGDSRVDTIFKCIMRDCGKQPQKLKWALRSACSVRGVPRFRRNKNEFAAIAKRLLQYPKKLFLDDRSNQPTLRQFMG